MNPPAPSTPLAIADDADRHARRLIAVFLGLVVLLAAAAVLRLCVGETFGWPDGELGGEIIRIRATRLIQGMIIGAALALAGTSLQALLRNPLAEPYILGLSAGAAVGLMAQMMLFHRIGWFPVNNVAVALGGSHVGATLGALLSMAVVYALGRRHGVIDPLGLLLVGVVIGTINGAIIILLNYLAGPGVLRDDVMRWMMGYLSDTVAIRTIIIVGVLTLLGGAVLFRYGRAMDVATFDDIEAEALGVNLRRLRRTLFAVSGLLAAGAVVLAGPIAFIGLIAPHVARLLIGPAHRPLLIAAALLGGTLIIAADTTAAAIDVGQGRLPMGIFTATLGGIAFLWLLRPHLGAGR